MRCISLCPILFLSFFLVSCVDTQNIPTPDALGLGAITLAPPVSKLAVGTLFYVDKNANLSKPTHFEQLCRPNLIGRGFREPESAKSDLSIDLLKDFSASGGLSGIETAMLKLGIDGKITDYFEYKLTNIEVVDYDLVTANNIYENMNSWIECQNWRSGDFIKNQAIHQIKTAYRGDLVFSKKFGTDINANLTAKLNSIEPKITAALKSVSSSGVSGNSLFVVVHTIQRS